MTSAPLRLCCRLSLCLVINGTLGGASFAAQPYPFSLTSESVDGGQHIVARNRGPAPVSVRLALTEWENIRSSHFMPIYAVIRPHSQVVLLRVTPAHAGKPHHFVSETTYSTGNYRAQHDATALYRLPFENGRRFAIGQSHDGPRLTHHSPDSEFAVDFTMPENTPVVAARDGVVIETEARHKFGGTARDLLTEANFVRLLHADDSIATYAHLAPGGVHVMPGQQVTAGMLIGRSGATGYARGPHLHFVVHQLMGSGTGFRQISVPLRFYAGNPPRTFAARYGETLTADYSPSGVSVRGVAPTP